jgi:hypothetical protein
MTNTDLKSPSKTYFQAFRVPGEKDHILIPVFQHPSQKELYVIWSDITDCFPGVTRIQYANVYIPKLRDSRLYRYPKKKETKNKLQEPRGLYLDIIWSGGVK